ncbi:xanthine phosphoribosyltransferase [Longirhabdus pacifica]|uniref:xanthine phosphoribosyltransferase n=1 Tax=Longirhabdus pacifica TaxID=2305227 RepID=UPI001008BA93|nr:xanthine phosphoribosyltransferase [Longirhabdus pacifica]
MDIIKKKIQDEARVVDNNVLQLDTILNHLIDPSFMMEVGKEFASRFSEKQIDKVVTVESSGIPVAFATAMQLQVPFVFARKRKTKMTSDQMLSERVASYTQGVVVDILLSPNVIKPNEQVLIVDDIISNGEVLNGLIQITKRAGADVVGAGVVLEKSYEKGAEWIRSQHIDLQSIVTVSSVSNSEIQFK